MSFVLSLTFAADSLIDAQQKAEAIATASDGAVISLRPDGLDEDTPLDACERERIALADAFRSALEAAHFHPTTAAIVVQDVIDRARRTP